MKRLFITTALLETGAGVALLAVPSEAVTLLLGFPLTTPAAVTLGRVTGTALLALGVACWLAHSDGQSGAARGLASAMTIYNLGVAAILGAAGMGFHLAGVVLWPAVLLHAVMTAWCIASWFFPRPATEKPNKVSPP